MDVCEKPVANKIKHKKIVVARAMILSEILFITGYFSLQPKMNLEQPSAIRDIRE